MTDTTVFVRPFKDIRLTDRPTVGGKCASLGELIAAGIDVPDGYAVTVEAFETFRAESGLRQPLRDLVVGVAPDDPRTLDAAHREAERLIVGAPLPAGIDEAIRAAYRKLCAQTAQQRGLPADAEIPVAVRSSAVAEDGDAASFAGQQETYLWVVGEDDVIEHVKRCWASLYTPQAVAYRSKLPEDQAYEASRISVAVQVMVDAYVSGVTFTVSPRTGDRSVMAVNASWGLGHAVVSGEVTPDEFWLSKVGPSITTTRVAHKATACVPDPSGRGVTTVDVPEDRQDVPCLDEQAVLALAELGLRVERHYKCPQDIEWSYERGPGGELRLLVLQSRPETLWKTRKEQAKRASAPVGLTSLLAGVRGAGGDRK